MDAFRVWVRPMDYEYRVLVEGLENAAWLLLELSRAFVFKSAQPINSARGSTLCSFQVPYNAMLPYGVFQRLLKGMPRVTVIMQTAPA
jgi:hypothetical protein